MTCATAVQALPPVSGLFHPTFFAQIYIAVVTEGYVRIGLSASAVVAIVITLC
jgi:hypothetical protein